MSEITIFSLYLLAAAAFGLSRLPRYSAQTRTLAAIGSVTGALGFLLHGSVLGQKLLSTDGFSLSVFDAVSVVGFEIALIALLAAIRVPLRGLSAALLLLAATAAPAVENGALDSGAGVMSWQIKSHILISLLSYGLLTVGAIVAVFTLLQERRLKHGGAAATQGFLPPLVTTESLLFGIATAGFTGLLLAIVSGAAFVNNLFAQHLAHKTVFSLLALVVFGTLLLGRYFAGWRGVRAVKLYLGGFFLLFLAYFGARFILEQLLNRSWG